MKINLLLSVLTAACLCTSLKIQAQSTNETSSLHDRIQLVATDVVAKFQNGKTTEADYADDFKRFDQLIAEENKGTNKEEAATLVFMKAQLYLQIVQDLDKGAALVKQIKADYPDTLYGKHADMILADIAKETSAKKAQAGLKTGSAFPDFSEKDLNGNPISDSALKGKVVLVDFWATWCPPCRAELPNVIATYKKHHGEGFEVIGVSLDSDRDQLKDFLKKQDGMTWPQYYDGLGWDNKLATKYGVRAIPFTILIGPDGKIIGTELTGDDLENAVAKAVSGVKL